jgi:hypothetical protein
MLRIPTLSLLAALCGALATGCSSKETTTSAAAGQSGAATVVTAAHTPGTRADSLGGILGHKFGEPLSAFPGLALTPSQKPGTQTYQYPDGNGEPGWFGKHKKESPTEFFSYYTFKDGRFVAFQAMALGAGRKALQEQTRFLLGTGTPTTTTTNWEGEKVLAYYSLTNQPGAGLAEVLDVQSQDFVKGQATAKAEQLKKENAQ